MVLTLA
jgi:hypothetical protein